MGPIENAMNSIAEGGCTQWNSSGGGISSPNLPPDLGKVFSQAANAIPQILDGAAPNIESGVKAGMNALPQLATIGAQTAAGIAGVIANTFSQGMKPKR